MESIKEFNYEKAVEYLLAIPKFVKKTDSKNICELLKRMGNPERRLKVLHIAGTNGKGSTCAFLNSILMECGKSVGMFTSPHLVKINERIKINGIDVSDQMFLQSFKKVMYIMKKMIDDGYEHLSFFEMIFALALVVFNNSRVEYAILETGLGGRLDATNIIEKPMVSIITTISFDHMEILGDTIEAIAGEKAGIIKQGVPVVYYGENEKVAKVIADKAKEKDTPSYVLKRDMIKIIQKNNKAIDFCFVNMYDSYGELSVPFRMEYQAYNCGLAIMALSLIKELEINREILLSALNKTAWPGRMEEIKENIFVDGAHNEEGLKEFAGYVGSLKENVYVLFSVVKEKDYIAMIKHLTALTNIKKIVIASVGGYRAISADRLLTAVEAYNKNINTEIVAKTSVTEAFRYAVNDKAESEKLFCVGSLYMVGEIKEYIGKEKHYD